MERRFSVTLFNTASSLLWPFYSGPNKGSNSCFLIKGLPLMWLDLCSSLCSSVALCSGIICRVWYDYSLQWSCCFLASCVKSYNISIWCDGQSLLRQLTQEYVNCQLKWWDCITVFLLKAVPKKIQIIHIYEHPFIEIMIQLLLCGRSAMNGVKQHKAFCIWILRFFFRNPNVRLLNCSLNYVEKNSLNY